MYSVETINYWLSLGTVAMEGATIVLLALFVLRNKIPDLQQQAALLSRWGMWIAFLTTFVGSALTLFYSEILGFEPCPLCWWQRVFLYPQVVLLGLALWRRDRSIVPYSIALSVIGAGVALYQHVLQMLPSGTLPCPATGTVSCAQRFVFEFGYVTFPFMAVSLFALLIVLMLFVRMPDRNNQARA